MPAQILKDDFSFNTGTAVSIARFESAAGGAAVSSIFIASDSYNLTRIDYYLSKVAAPTGNIVCEIYSISGYSPSSLLATSTNTIDATTLTGAFESFSFDGLNVVDGTRYGVVIRFDDYSYDGTDYLATTRGAYIADEVYITQSGDGSSWSMYYGHYQTAFMVYGDAVVDQVTRGGGMGGWVQSWLLIAKRIIDGTINQIREMSSAAIQNYLYKPPHKQITGDFRATVVKVHDGDTITLRVPFRNFDFPLRIANIDAPELSEGGNIARDWLKDRILGKEVLILINPKNRVGKYGRLIGEVMYNGFNMGETMMRLGIVAPFGKKRASNIPNFGKFMNEVKF